MTQPLFPLLDDTYDKEGKKKKKITNIAEGSDAIIEIRSMFNNIHAKILDRSLAESTSVNPKRRKKFKLRGES